MVSIPIDRRAGSAPPGVRVNRERRCIGSSQPKPPGDLLSRRHVLAGVAALGAAAMLPCCEAHAQSGRARVIDTHHHFYPPAYQKSWLDWEDARKIPHFANQVTWTPEKAIEDLDRSGIATAVLSIASTPGTWFGLDAAGAEAMVRTCNDYGAEMIRDHKGRFGLFAITKAASACSRRCRCSTSMPRSRKSNTPSIPCTPTASACRPATATSG
jgi:hypothetical protein